MPDKDTVNNNRALALSRDVFENDLKTIHGIIYGTKLRRIPTVAYAVWGLVLRWQFSDPSNYFMKMIRPSAQHTFRGNFEEFSTLMIYSFDHVEDLEKEPAPNVDMSDILDGISDISFQPEVDDSSMGLFPDDDVDMPAAPTSAGNSLIFPPAPPAPPAPPPVPPPSMPPNPPEDPGLPRSPAPRARKVRFDMDVDFEEGDMDIDEEGNNGQPPAPPAPPPTPLPTRPSLPPVPRNPIPPSIPQPTPPSGSDQVPSRRASQDQLHLPREEGRPSTQPTPIRMDISDSSDDNDFADGNDLNRSRSRSPRQRPGDSAAAAEIPAPSQESKHEEPSSKKSKPETVVPASSTIAPLPDQVIGSTPGLAGKDDETIDYGDQSLDRSRTRDYGQSPCAAAAPDSPILPLDDSSSSSTPAVEPSSAANDSSSAPGTDEWKQLYIQTKTILSDSSPLRNYLADIQHHEEAINAMFLELQEELSYCLESSLTYDFVYHFNSGKLYRVDDDTRNLTDDDMRRYSAQVLAADRKELHQFVKNKVFKKMHKSRSPAGANVVDCIWVRKWTKSGEIKSRLCARGCFDRQKQLIEKHSSTASRLSQRLVISQFMVDGLLYTEDPYYDPVELISLDISSAFLQGLDYEELIRCARDLGYESRFDSEVFVIPPENVWRHVRALVREGSDLYVDDKDRGQYVLQCLRAMYGFADAPLMFQLCLIHVLISKANACKSVFDDNYLMVFCEYDHGWELVIVFTVHVDDLLLAGSRSSLRWIKGILEQRFGELKEQRMPFTHTGLELEMVNKDCLRLHQDSFNQKLTLHTFEGDRARDPEAICTSAETTSFRSICCACLWGAQTRPEELCSITGLQQKLKAPQIKDLILVNTVVKRLRKVSSPTGIYFWRLTPPLHAIVVTDASGANKRSDYAVEGIAMLISEDKTGKLHPDKNDFISGTAVQNLGGKCHLMFASGSKSRRVSHSTSVAETLAAARGISMGQLLAVRYTEFDILRRSNSPVTPLMLLQLQDSAQIPMPVDMIIDCMDCWELCCGYRGIPQDKSVRLAILALREERRTHRLRRLFHCRTKWMLADMLTKSLNADSVSLKQLVTCGHWRISDEVRVRTLFGRPSASSQGERKHDLSRDLVVW